MILIKQDLMEQRRYEFKYTGTNFLDINTLLSSQFHFLAIVNEIQRQTYPNARIKIKVGSFSEGSFIINLLFESSLVQDIFNTVVGISPAILSDILKCFSEFINLYETLKGKKPDNVTINGDNIVIHINGNSNPVTIDKRVYNIYTQNPIVNTSVQQNFDLLDADESISGITITDKEDGKEIIDIPRVKFDALKQVNECFSSNIIQQTYSNETVYIKKPNLFPDKSKSLMWGFIHRGRDITARVSDKDFLQKINEGLKIGQGDRLLVDILAYLKYDERVATFVETSKYEIIKVYKIHDRSRQFKLDDFIP